MDGSGYGMNGAGSWMFGAFLLMGTVLLGVLVARWLHDSAARGRKGIINVQ